MVLFMVYLFCHFHCEAREEHTQQSLYTLHLHKYKKQLEEENFDTTEMCIFVVIQKQILSVDFNSMNTPYGEHGNHSAYQIISSLGVNTTASAECLSIINFQQTPNRQQIFIHRCFTPGTVLVLTQRKFETKMGCEQERCFSAYSFFVCFVFSISSKYFQNCCT